MPNEFEEDETSEPMPGVAWMQSDDIELDEMCSKYRELQSTQKLHESVVKELTKPIKALAEQIQARMGGNKAVRTSMGYQLRWVPFTRKGYTVAASEGERWQLRSPF